MLLPSIWSTSARAHTWQYNMHRWRKFGWGLQHPRSYCSSTKDATTSELLLWDFRMGEIAVSCSIFAITCKCVLHRWSRGWGEVNCNMMQQATTRSKLWGVLAEMVHIMCGHVCFAGEDWWDMKSTQQWMHNIGVCRTISGSTSAHEPNPVKYNYITINKYVPREIWLLGWVILVI